MSLEAVNSRVQAFETEHGTEAAKMMKGGISQRTSALNQVMVAREEAGRAKENLNAFIVDLACEKLTSRDPDVKKEGIILISQALSLSNAKDIQNIFRALHNKGQRENLDIHEIIDGTLFFLANSKDTKDIRKAIAVCKDKVLFPPADLPSAKIGKPDISTAQTKALGVLKIIERYLDPNLAGDERAALRYFTAKQRWEELKAFQETNPDNEKLKELVSGKEADIEKRLEKYAKMACKLNTSQQKLLDQVEKNQISPTAPGVTSELRCIMSKAMARCMYISPKEGPDYEKAVATIKTIMGKGAAVRQNIIKGDPGINPAKEKALKKQDDTEVGNFRPMLGSFLQNGVPTHPDKEDEFVDTFRQVEKLGEILKKQQDPQEIGKLLQVRQENRAKLRDMVPPDFRDAYDDLDQMNLKPAEIDLRNLEQLQGKKELFTAAYNRVSSSKSLTPAMQKFVKDCKEKFDEADRLEKAAKAEKAAKTDPKDTPRLLQYSEVYKLFAAGAQMADGLKKIADAAFQGKEATTQAKEFQAALVVLKERSEKMLEHFKDAFSKDAPSEDSQTQLTTFVQSQTDSKIDGNTKARKSQEFFLQQGANLTSITKETSKFDIEGYAQALLAIEKGVKELGEQFKGATVSHDLSEVLKEFFDGQGMRLQVKGDLPSTVARGKLLEMAGRVVQQGTRPELLFKEILKLAPDADTDVVEELYSKLKTVADILNRGKI